MKSIKITVQTAENASLTVEIPMESHDEMTGAFGLAIEKIKEYYKI